VKAIREDSSKRGIALPGRFCDWTEDSRILVGEETGLGIYNKYGKPLRVLSPPVKPANYGMAAYRKYGHR